MSRFFDPSTHEGQFYALVLLLLVFVGVRIAGFEWAAKGYEDVLIALLVVLRAPGREVPKP